MYLHFVFWLALTSAALSFTFNPSWRSLSNLNNELSQKPLDLSMPSVDNEDLPHIKPSKHRALKGRFLHITDIHPDPFYKENTDPDTACHRGKDKKGRTGKYGHPISPCDSPMTLVNATFDWIAKNLKDEIDFIVWTGDNVRHDRDNKHPRTESHIFDMNELMVSKFLDFLKCDDPIHLFEVPVVPSLGNNDVYPHNLFAEGPTLQTREFYRIWKDMVPENQLHSFSRGASFMTEVIPGKLAVIALNTLYWFQSNPIIDGCDKRKDPGHKQFRYLSIILQEFRERGMKVWLSGHVPPNAKNFEPTCLDRYSAWMHEYRDVVVGGLFGHMNVDHFMFLDSEATTPELSVEEKNSMKFTCSVDNDDNIISTLGKIEYLDDLRETYAELEDDESLNTRYFVSHVGSSIIPTYFPGLRVWEYNITGVDDDQSSVYSNGQPFRPWSDVFAEIEQEFARLDEEDEYSPLGEEELAMSSLDFQKKKKKKADPTWPPNSDHDVKPGPAYLPQTFTPTRYVQYFVNLTEANTETKEFTFEKEYSTDQLPYNMTNLVVSSWVKFGRKLATELITKNDESDFFANGKNKKNKKDTKKAKKRTKKEIEESHQAWKTYLKHAFISSGFEFLDN